jgi:hypothetical protein
MDSDEVIAVFWALADILAGVNGIKDLLLEDDGEETED